MISEALDLYKEAEKSASSKESTASLGAAPVASTTDIVAAMAQAYVEKARVDYILTADDDDDDSVNAKVLATLAEARKHMDRCIVATDTLVGKADREVSLSRALLNLAQSDLDEEPEVHGPVLDMAIDAAAKALEYDAQNRSAAVQQAACLVAKAKCEGEPQMELLDRAVKVLRGSLGSSDANDEAEKLQLLAQALIQYGRIHPEDDKAEELIGEGVECYRKAATLQPENRKLKQLVEMIQTQENS